jgi:hypothetical protein
VWPAYVSAALRVECQFVLPSSREPVAVIPPGITGKTRGDQAVNDTRSFQASRGTRQAGVHRVSEPACRRGHVYLAYYVGSHSPCAMPAADHDAAPARPRSRAGRVYRCRPRPGRPARHCGPRGPPPAGRRSGRVPRAVQTAWGIPGGVWGQTLGDGRSWTGIKRQRGWPEGPRGDDGLLRPTAAGKHPGLWSIGPRRGPRRRHCRPPATAGLPCAGLCQSRPAKAASAAAASSASDRSSRS